VINLYILLCENHTDLYVSDFQVHFLEVSTNYYETKSNNWIETCNVSNYLKLVEQAFNEERDRIYGTISSTSYLAPVSELPLITVLNNTLLKSKLDFLFDGSSGLAFLIQTRALDDIQRLFDFISHVEDNSDLLKRMSAILVKYIKTNGMELLVERFGAERKDEDDMVEDESEAGKADGKKILPVLSQKDETANMKLITDLINFLEPMRSLVAIQFKQDPIFVKGLKEGFEFVVNQDLKKFKDSSQSSMAMMLASFSDKIMKSDNRSSTASSTSSSNLPGSGPGTGSDQSSKAISDEAQTENTINRIVALFSHVNEKDLFSESYRNLFAKRLLNSKSISLELERYFISKLKSQCGNSYTSKFDTMVSDLMNAQRNSKLFLDYISSEKSNANPTNRSNDLERCLPIDFSVQVLTNGAWPTFPSLQGFRLPIEMQSCLNVYETFYKSKTEFADRKLSFQHSLGTVTIEGKWGKGDMVYEISLTTLQAAVLLCYNAHDSRTIESIRAELNLTFDMAKRIILSLVVGKLLLRPGAPDVKTAVKPDEIFLLNQGFKSPLRRVKMPTVSLEETHPMKRVVEDRTNMIEAAIVRVMKTRKNLSVQVLLSEVISLLHFFRPDPILIKQRIAPLVERGYLEADDTMTNVTYLA
jgi:cullin 1